MGARMILKPAPKPLDLPPLPESLRAVLFPHPISPETVAKWKAQLEQEKKDAAA